jgi:hypothetical protein
MERNNWLSDRIRKKRVVAFFCKNLSAVIEDEISLIPKLQGIESVLKSSQLLSYSRNSSDFNDLERLMCYA